MTENTGDPVNITMHIEFDLPSRFGGQIALYTSGHLLRHLEQWSELYGYQHRVTIQHYKVWIEFNNIYAYTLFALTWSLARPQWRIIED